MGIGKIGGLRRIGGGMGGEVGGNKRGEETREKTREETREETRDGIAWNGDEKGMYGAFLYLEL